MKNESAPPTPGPKCSECGTQLPPAHEEALCPRCLLNVGIGTEEPAGDGPTLVVPEGSISPRRLPEPGETFGGYRIERKLGQGGMGAVYEAEHLESGRRVALKVLGHSLDSADARRRFLREGRLAASINHPNSVYVFGTDEIDGTPVITMELVTGGNLEEKVQTQGAMVVPKAVDAILQIIAGLDAAQKVGILHRDIKPSNCFVTLEGDVKVGDFGLSIPTEGRENVALTSDGTFMGTPAFSSPEQIRGDELSIRSDIYSVGVTLYYLLTGKAPFAAKNVAQLLATVLERAPESPAQWCSNIPPALCQVVLKCLDKNPAHRYRNYEELQAALLPFTSTAPNAATLGLRFLAGMTDALIFSVLGGVVTFSGLAGIQPLDPDFMQSTKFMWFSVISVLIWASYYGLMEGIWGFSLGKALFRLRVVKPDRSSPGFAKSMQRALIFVLLPVLPIWIYNFTYYYGGKMVDYRDPTTIMISYTYYGILALIFCMARRRNGYAALHDFMTDTRVIQKPALTSRPVLEVADGTPADTQGLPKVGPYFVLETLEQSECGEELVVGYDAQLLRKVWIRKFQRETPPISPYLRRLSRVGRLRWLNGLRTADGCWDAYEALSGQSLVKLIRQGQPWSHVRFWLLDLAEELAVAEKDQTLPQVLDLDRIWITSDGRAKLLDFQVGDGIAESGSPRDEGGSERATLEEFLHQVAVSALIGQALPLKEALAKPLRVPLPLSAREWLGQLPKKTGLDSLIQELKPLLTRCASVSRVRRAGLVGTCLLVPLIYLGCIMFFQTMNAKWQREQPEIWPLFMSLQTMENFKRFSVSGDPSQTRDAYAVHISGRYGHVITNASTWTSLYARSMIPPPLEEKARQIVSDHPHPSAEQLAVAEALITERLGAGRLHLEDSGQQMLETFRSPKFMALILAFVTLGLVGLPSFLAALAVRGGPMLRLFGVAVAKRDGRRASRGRVMWRSLVCWSPLVLAMFMVGFLIPWMGEIPALILGMLLLGGLVLASVLLPGRSLQDRIAGTCLVPR